MSQPTSPRSSPVPPSEGSRSPACPRPPGPSGATPQHPQTDLSQSPAGGRPDTTGPFYLMKEPPEPAELTGFKNLMLYHGLEHSYNKLSSHKVKEELSAFLPNIPGNIDQPGSHDNSSLRGLFEKPPVGGKELLPLSGSALAGFRLHPGPLPEEYRLLNQPEPHTKKHKKKHRRQAAAAAAAAAEDVMAATSTEAATEAPLDAGTGTSCLRGAAEENKDDAKKKDKKKKKKNKKEKDKE